jgi:signal transduction histidine kinase
MRTIFHSLFWRIAILFFVVFVIVGGVYVYISLFTAEMYVQETDQRMNRALAALFASRIDGLIEPTVQNEPINAFFRDLEKLHPGVEPYLVDTTGMIITTSLPHPPASHMVSLAPIHSYLSDDASGMYLGDDPCGLVEEKVFSVAPVKKANGDPLGYLYIVLHGQEYESLTDRLFDSYILTLGSRSLGVTLAAAIAISLIILAFLLGRLKRLTASVREFGTGNHTVRAPVQSRDEIGDLAGTFNTMADTIQKNIEDLKASDNMRRDFFANISHDLKTPLTSIHGFAETLMLKWKGLPDEQREQYLDTILSRTERLSGMVHQILELSRLESGGAELSVESIDIKDMMSDIFLEFTPHAEKKGISLDSHLTEAPPSLIGDIGLIERALRNLVDNALRHTKSGGTVSVTVSSSGTMAVFHVSDTGEGIPADHVAHIFDRFYRADKSRTGRKTNTGLGLPITKQIVEMHDGTIEVESSENEGTRITLRLPLSGPRQG